MSDPDRDARIRSYYRTTREFDRLGNDEGFVEFFRTMRLIERQFVAGSTVLDLGGGPGRYTLELAQRGFHTTLLDFSPEQIGEAQTRVATLHPEVQANVDACVVGDARVLPEQWSQRFDAVLCAGPLYHCDGEAEAEQVLSEVRRILKPGGRCIGAFIPRLTAVSGLIARAAALPEQLPVGTLTDVFETGSFENPVDTAFGAAFFIDPGPLRRLAESLGFEVLSVESVRGLAAPYCSAFRSLSEQQPELFEEALDLIERSASLPEVVAMASHAVIVLQR